MKKKHILTIVILLSIGFGVQAQNCGTYLPREYQSALQNKSRTQSGAPGEAYFQNRADYTIEATFDPQTRILTGSESISYLNNRSDSLKTIVLNIDHDIFKAGTNRVYEVDPEDLTDGVRITQVKLNEEDVLMTPPFWQRDGTEVYLRLKKPLAPNSSLTLELEWTLIHPLKTQIRSGTYDSLSFFMAYWFPRIAVYDDVFGWDYSQHLGSGEFYNDFGNFDVSVTLPGNYLMWATGELQNGPALFQEQTLGRLKKAAESRETVAIVTLKDLEENKVLKPGNTKVWHFTAENVTDFAFGISPVYQWDAASVKLPGGKKVLVQAAYPQKAVDFKEVVSIGAKTIEMMSGEITGFPYPYPSMTVFCGHGGMEFPMIVNDGPADNPAFTTFVTSHEISHIWFPFIAGFNETRYGWMDEGLITFLPKKIEQTYIPESNPNRNYMRSYARWAGREDDINMTVPSNSIANTVSYRQNVYARAAAAFYHLGDAMGEANFRKTLQTFLEEWSFKHPSPYDFINTCSRIAGEDLSWYFNPWFFENGYPDLAIGNVETGDEKTVINILRKGNIPVPIQLRFTYNDGSSEVYHASSHTWSDGAIQFEVSLDSKKKPESIELGDENIPDAYPEDNIWKTGTVNK